MFLKFLLQQGHKLQKKMKKGGGFLQKLKKNGQVYGQGKQQKVERNPHNGFRENCDIHAQSI